MSDCSPLTTSYKPYMNVFSSKAQILMCEHGIQNCCWSELWLLSPLAPATLNYKKLCHLD